MKPSGTSTGTPGEKPAIPPYALGDPTETRGTGNNRPDSARGSLSGPTPTSSGQDEEFQFVKGQEVHEVLQIHISNFDDFTTGMTTLCDKLKEYWKGGDGDGLQNSFYMNSQKPEMVFINNEITFGDNIHISLSPLGTEDAKQNLENQHLTLEIVFQYLNLQLHKLFYKRSDIYNNNTDEIEIEKTLLSETEKWTNNVNTTISNIASPPSTSPSNVSEECLDKIATLITLTMTTAELGEKCNTCQETFKTFLRNRTPYSCIVASYYILACMLLLHREKDSSKINQLTRTILFNLNSVISNGSTRDGAAGTASTRARQAGDGTGTGPGIGPGTGVYPSPVIGKGGGNPL